jgi:hypothetical protein
MMYEFNFLPKNENTSFYEEDQDPFIAYGAGIKAYFKFLKQLMFTYAVICIMVIPVLGIYSSYDGFNDTKNQWLI